jgi:biotin carboxyl carrier protein
MCEGIHNSLTHSLSHTLTHSLSHTHVIQIIATSNGKVEIRVEEGAMVEAGVVMAMLEAV